MPKLLVLSFYYPPDLCPGSFRCAAFIEALQPLISAQYDIEIITTLPNRYASFETVAQLIESQPGLTIQRIPLPSHRSGMFDQARAFFYFAKEVRKLTKNKQYNLIFATSSRLMTAVLAAYLARRCKSRLYLDIRDIFTDTLTDILPKFMANCIKPLFFYLERWSFRQAEQLNVISQGFESYFRTYYPQAKLSWFSNGIDPEFILEESPFLAKTSFTVLYAGNIGQGQGLERIVPVLAKRMEHQLRFKIIGDGGRKSQLMAQIAALKCTNIEVLSPVNRDQLIKEYQAADVLFLHLNNYEAFLKVLPSKIFEYAATGKPIWAGVSGYAKQFIQTEIGNAVTFFPCQIEEAIESFHALQLQSISRAEFIHKFQRKKIMDHMANDLVSYFL